MRNSRGEHFCFVCLSATPGIQRPVTQARNGHEILHHAQRLSTFRAITFTTRGSMKASDADGIMFCLQQAAERRRVQSRCIVQDSQKTSFILPALCGRTPRKRKKLFRIGKETFPSTCLDLFESLLGHKRGYKVNIPVVKEQKVCTKDALEDKCQ